MKQFAIYYIPNNIDLYKKGSELIGYNIIKESSVKTSKNKYIAIAQKYNEKSRGYGFHLTLTDVVDINEKKLNEAIKRSKFIFNLPIFRKIIIKRNKIGLMPNANVLAIQYRFDFRFFLLHLLLVVFVQRLGYRSYYTNHTHTLSLLRKIKTKLFLSPYIVDDFLPHITLVQNFLTEQQSEMLRYLRSMFSEDTSLHIGQIAVVVKENEKTNFKIIELLRE